MYLGGEINAGIKFDKEGMLPRPGPHRIPHNETYWTDCPRRDNPCINNVYWSRIWLLVLLNLQPKS